MSTDVDVLPCRYCGHLRRIDTWCGTDECAERVAAGQAEMVAEMSDGHGWVAPRSGGYAAGPGGKTGVPPGRGSASSAAGVSDEQLDEWERLANEATPGPWSADDEHGLIEGGVPAWCVSRMRPGYEAILLGGYLGDIAYTTGTNEEPDAGFIAAAREALPALLGEVRASHAREAGQRAATILANKVWAEAATERDVLQQRIDKALELHQEVSRPAYGGQITDTAGNPVPFTPPYSVSCSCGKPYCTIRAALTGTDNQSTEETP